MKRRTVRRFLLIGFLAFIGFAIVANYWVVSTTSAQLYDDINLIPHHKVGLLLGTSKSGRHGWFNYYYKYRIDAAVALFKAGKIDYILVSGDNSRHAYNEPETMQADLLAAGIPADRIVLDFAGFRTLDSILRCLYVFDEDNITIISQEFHNQRALFIANHKNVHAIAFNARDIKGGIRTQIREKLARVKLMFDLLVNRGPKFYGPKIKIG